MDYFNRNPGNGEQRVARSAAQRAAQRATHTARERRLWGASSRASLQAPCGRASPP